MIIEGKKIANYVYSNLKKAIETLEKKPILWVILVWQDPVSLRYVNQKRRLASFVGIWFALKELDKDVSEDKLIETIKEFNEDRNISWFIIQLPLPKNIDTNKILNCINPDKDVDWFSPKNMWKVLIWDDTGFVPCTPLWIMEIFKYLKTDLAWKNVTIIWRSNIVWKPLAALFINNQATVTVCNSKTPDIWSITQNADIIICAAWSPNLLTLDMIKSEAIVIDVWFSIIDGKVYWDADYKNMSIAWVNITPVPWWVWPLTVAMLMQNTFKSFKKWKTLN